MGLACSSNKNRNGVAQVKELRPDGEWNLPRGSEPRMIRSIHIDEKDNHVFLVDYENDSIIELNERGEIRTEFRFDDQNNEGHFLFTSFDICSISPDILVVCGKDSDEGKMVFLEREQNPPFLKVKKNISTHETQSLSLCSGNESIFCLDSNCKIHSFSKEGEKMQTTGINELAGSFGFKPRIRVDPSSGELWWSAYDSFNTETKNVDFTKKGGEKIDDFSFDKYGQLYFPTKEGIFSSFPKIKLLYKFPEKPDYLPQISVSENKILVCIQNNGKDVVKFFKIIYCK